MDDRDRRQVEIGAGLQESRLNTELIEWLQKWGPRALYVLLAIVLGYLGYIKWIDFRQTQIDKAFAEYQDEKASKNPDVLLDVAAKHDGKGSVWTLATLDAADLLLTGARLGVNPGVGANAATESDVISDDVRDSFLRSALQHYEAALERNDADPDRARFAQKARWGIASAAISLGQIDRARTILNDYVDAAERHGFPENLLLGRQRLDALDKVAEPIVVHTTAQLPEANRPPQTALPDRNIQFAPAPGDTSGISLPPGVELERLDPADAQRRLFGGAEQDQPAGTGDVTPQPTSTEDQPDDTPTEPESPAPEPAADPE